MTMPEAKKPSPGIEALVGLLDRESMSSGARLYRRGEAALILIGLLAMICLLYTSPSPRD